MSMLRTTLAGLVVALMEGETGLMVYTILVHLWAGTPGEDPRPCLFLMSD